VRPAIYILTNKWNRVLYTGVTADLRNRLRVHRARLNPESFTSRYKVVKLVYYEFHPNMLKAIAREKQIKGGSRADKLRLIEKMNPGWVDLSAGSGWSRPRDRFVAAPSRRAPRNDGPFPDGGVGSAQ
jgi:putative endonuclease